MARYRPRLRDRKAPAPAERPGRCGCHAPPRAFPDGNQARLRAAPAPARAKCRECEQKERGSDARHSDRAAGDRTQHTGGSGSAGATPPVAAARPTSVDVWGFQVTRAMCGCRQRVRDDIDWANEAAATYRACNTPANPTATDVEACFAAAQPGAVVVATTSSSGVVTLPPASADPCDRLSNRATSVHETMHSRHADSMARAQGAAFFQAWRHLAGAPDRLDQLRSTFPTEVAAFEAQWTDGADWASDEVHSYTWERMFLQSALSALNRICP